MAQQTIEVRLIQRNDTASEWKLINPVLLKGEFGVETDTNKIKIGDGIKTWNELTYAGGESSSGSHRGVYIGPTPPTETDVLWLDTMDEGTAGLDFISLTDSVTNIIYNLRFSDGRIEFVTAGNTN